MYLKDTCPLAGAILAGEHDAVLAYAEQAIAARKRDIQRESGIRKHARIRVTEGSLAGREGVVERVNTKTVTVKLDPLPGLVAYDPDATALSQPSESIDWHTEWRVSHAIIEAV